MIARRFSWKRSTSPWWWMKLWIECGTHAKNPVQAFCPWSAQFR